MGLGTGEVFDGNAVSEKKTALKHALGRVRWDCIRGPGGLHGSGYYGTESRGGWGQDVIYFWREWFDSATAFHFTFY